LIAENALLKYNQTSKINLNVPENITIFGDEFHVYNLIFNLVDNGIKYGGNQPVIDIQVEGHPKETMLTLEDSGSGISEKDMEYIFDKFYRVPREDKKEVAGFGLGLFYVKRMVDLHGWKIKMISQQPKGLKVVLRIPNKLISN
jgi:two-component system phosphate regulon sensor histidine kinase PhoR